MLQRIYSLSPRSRLVSASERRRLVCDHPLQVIELNASAAALLAALRPGLPLNSVAGGVTAETVAFLDELVTRGALRADYRLLPARDPAPLEVIVPAFEDAAALARCLAGLAAQDDPSHRLRVTVVDDASPRVLQGRVPVPPSLELRWLRLPVNAGPASARNAGVETPWPDGAPPAPWLAFLDADCVPAQGWLKAVAALLEEPTVAAAGGAVRGLTREGLLARYEDACSSLYLGPAPGPVGMPAGVLSYLPSCNLALKRSVYESVGGFRAGWRFAEDVDLCWRIAAAGQGLFYHPAAEVAHAHRIQWGPFLRRRRAYARSEALLRRVHPARFPRTLNSGTLLVLTGLGAALLSGNAGWLTFAGLAFAAQVVGPLWRAQMAPRERGTWPRRSLLAAGLRRSVALLLLHGRHGNRQALAWWLLLPVLWPPLAPLAGAVFAAGALGEWLARRPRVPHTTLIVGYAAECLAYSVGRAEGALAQVWSRTRWNCWKRPRKLPASAETPSPDAPLDAPLDTPLNHGRQSGRELEQVPGRRPLS